MFSNSVLQEELNAIRAQSLYRECRTLEALDGVHAYWNGKKLLLFCGNDYLGLSHHPRVITAVKKEVERLGVGSGAARLISGTTDFHTRLEEKLARLKQKERALLFSTGYLANLGILSAMAGEKDLIVMDKLCHASIIDGAKLSGAALRVFPHKNYKRCREILEKADPRRKKILVSETVFSMDGDIADLKELVRIKKGYGCLLVVDDAHGTGVLGTHGGGAAEDQKLQGDIDIIMGTLSKALGCLGGFAAASKTIVEYLVNRSRTFIFATSLPPILCAAAYEALCLLEEEPEIRHRLWRNIQKIHEGLGKIGFGQSPAINAAIFPITIGQEDKALHATELLLERGILIPAVRTPTVPKGKARLRLTVSAAHSDRDIDDVLSALRDIQGKI